MTGPLVVSVCCLFFCIIAFLYFRFYIVKRTSFDGVMKDVRDEVSRLLQRIDEITDKDITLIEDKEKGLRKLLEETDRRLAIMNRELAGRENAEKVYRKLGNSLVIENFKLSAAESAPPPKGEILEEDKQEEDQLRVLVRSGFSPQVIASRLGISISEAELAVALQERRYS